MDVDVEALVAGVDEAAFGHGVVQALGDGDHPAVGLGEGNAGEAAQLEPGGERGGAPEIEHEFLDREAPREVGQERGDVCLRVVFARPHLAADVEAVVHQDDGGVRPAGASGESTTTQMAPIALS
jgi:hypothetical protein